MAVLKSTKVKEKGKVVGIAKSQINLNQVDLKIMPRDLLGPIRESIVDFYNMNEGMKMSTIKKWEKNIEILGNNAKTYIGKERALVEEFIVVENDEPVLWNQVTTEKVYEEVEGGGKRLAGGKFRVQYTEKGQILVDSDGEQYHPKEGEEIIYLHKDITRKEEFDSKMKEVQNTPIDVKIILFTEAELENLTVPTVSLFLNIFVDGKY